MTTIERERPRLHSTHVERERPVFVADHGRRARLVRFVAGAVAVVAALWLVALAAGMLGFGRLPGVSIPVDRVVGAGGEADGPASHDRGTQAPAPSAERISASAGVTSLGQQASPRSRARPSTVAARTSARPQARRPQAPPQKPVQPQPQPVQPPPSQQGWARRGQPAPPGHARRAQTQPPPPALNNGQAKKLLPPPPPPPPGPGNGNGNGGGLNKP